MGYRIRAALLALAFGVSAGAAATPALATPDQPVVTVTAPSAAPSGSHARPSAPRPNRRPSAPPAATASAATPAPAGPRSANPAHTCASPHGPMLAFTQPVRPETEVVIAAVGDVLLHSSLQRQGFARPDGFRSLWRPVEDLLTAADITYANLEGPMAEGITKRLTVVTTPVERFDDSVYSGYPMFNYPPRVGPALRASGIRVVSTANNHALDRSSVGVDRTIEALNAAGIPFTGTRPSGQPDHPWYVITQVRDYRIAWLACSYSTNGIPDRRNQVLLCFDQRQTVLDTIAELRRRPDVDAVILTPHWGIEYMSSPNADQRELAHQALDAGAIAVIGSHPHVVQPWERYDTADGRQGFILYSLGNFVSGQRELPRRTSLILLLGLARTPAGPLAVAGVRYIPLRVNPPGTSPTGITVDAADRVGAAAQPNRDHLARLLNAANIHPPHAPFTTLGGCEGTAGASAGAGGPAVPDGPNAGARQAIP